MRSVGIFNASNVSRDGRGRSVRFNSIELHSDRGIGTGTLLVVNDESVILYKSTSALRTDSSVANSSAINVV
jgi:hypothetical protein